MGLVILNREYFQSLIIFTVAIILHTLTDMLFDPFLIVDYTDTCYDLRTPKAINY